MQKKGLGEVAAEPDKVPEEEMKAKTEVEASS
jgi:hypothetical protein